MKIKMQFKKSTKNTHVYEEIIDTSDPINVKPPIIPVLYIRKIAFTAYPETIEVEITSG